MKKLSIVFFILISVLSQAQTDTLIWSPALTYPDIATAGMYNESVVIGDTLYAHITGGAATTTINKYVIGDPSLGGGSWLTGVDLPTTLIGGFMVECGGLIYYIGGSTTAVNTSGAGVYCFDPATGLWSTKASLPVGLSGHGAVAWGDSVIFVMGGPWSTSTTTNLEVYYYRVATDTWGTNTGASGLPSGAGRRTFAIGIDGNNIIIAGGYAGAYLNSTYVGTIGTDATSITWTQVGNIPGTSSLSRTGGAAIDGHFFLVGGEKSLGGYSDTTHVYNFGTGTWQYSFPGKPNGVSNVFNSVTATKLSGDTVLIFVPGGYNGSNLACFDVAKFFAYPKPTITPSDTTYLCSGSSVTLTSSLADSYYWLPNGETTQSITVSAAGVYTVSVTNSDPLNGVGVSNPVTVILETLNTNVSISGNDIIADEASADSYQWLDCDNSMAIITGATSQSFTPTADGNYAVVISKNSCIDTSACISFVTGIEEDNNIRIHIYPNPAENVIQIQANVNDLSIVEIYNIHGQRMDVIDLNKTHEVNIEGYAKGMYTVRFQNESGFVSFIKE